MSLLKRICIALASFYLAGVVAVIVMSDPGTGMGIVLDAPLLAAVGMLIGPSTFVAGAWGLVRGHGSDMPPGLIVFFFSLAYVGYVALFFGACSKHGWIWILCLLVEVICAFVAAKGIAYCI